ncbi:MAG TPA: FtsX-like permease family protein [Chitinivibrionales bacterium]|jgi:putative ABC transport system permease protein|nr:FtsX-like permease family protein [Chitinivibrionales bacterium]
MFSLIRLAFRNVGRNRRRSILAFVSVAISLTVIVFAQGFVNGFVQSFVKNATKNDAGHIRIAAKKFEERSRFFPVSYTVANPDSVIRAIERDPAVSREIALVTPRITFGVLLSNGGLNKSALALAGDPEKEKELLLLQKSILPGGRYLSGPRDLIMGSAMAKSLRFRVGDTVRVMTSGSDYALHLKKFVVAGLFSTGMNVFDDMMFQIGMSDAQELLRTGNAAQQIIIMLKDYRNADRVAAGIRSGISDTSMSVTSWTRVGDTYTTVLLVTRIYGWIYVIIALLGAFIISNIMMMAVLERRKEIGILKAMGFRRSEVLVMFLAEGMMLGFVGSLAGVALGGAAVAIFHACGLDLTAYMSRISVPLDNVLYPAVGLANILYSVGLGTVLAALVSVAPARQAAGMNVVDAIKSV